MTPVRSILAATDFSSAAAKAVTRAAMIANGNQGELKLLHVLDSSGLPAMKDWLTGSLDLAAEMKSEAEISLAEVATTINESHQLEATHAVLGGAPFLALTEAARSADLLVLGARGRHPLLQVDLGTTTDRLLRTSTVPLLVVKRAPLATYRRVLVLVDFSRSSEAALRAALDFAPGADIHLLHAFEVPFEGRLRVAGVRDEDIAQYRQHEREKASEQMELLVASLAADRARIFPILERGDIRVQTDLTIQKIVPDLIATGKQGTSFLQDLFLGSVTRHMLAEVSCDVLVVPKKQVS